ncbi:MAG TPA: hypothetical protein VF432_07900 [Thermoanaerobaculia bacterium]
MELAMRTCRTIAKLVAFGSTGSRDRLRWSSHTAPAFPAAAARPPTTVRQSRHESTSVATASRIRRSCASSRPTKARQLRVGIDDSGGVQNFVRFTSAVRSEIFDRAVEQESP